MRKRPCQACTQDVIAGEPGSPGIVCRRDTYRTRVMHKRPCQARNQGVIAGEPGSSGYDRDNRNEGIPGEVDGEVPCGGSHRSVYEIYRAVGDEPERVCSRAGGVRLGGCHGVPWPGPLCLAARATSKLAHWTTGGGTLPMLPGGKGELRSLTPGDLNRGSHQRGSGFPDALTPSTPPPETTRRSQLVIAAYAFLLGVSQGRDNG